MVRVIILDVENMTIKSTSNFNNKIQANRLMVFNNCLFHFLQRTLTLSSIAIQAIFFPDENSKKFKCTSMATNHSCSLLVFSWALVAILVSLERAVNWPQLSRLCELACMKTTVK